VDVAIRESGAVVGYGRLVDAIKFSDQSGGTATVQSYGVFLAEYR
jgi:hypothetical protein